MFLIKYSENLISKLFCNEDYEPYAISRDTRIKELCQEKGIDFYSFKDHLIFHKNQILSQEGKPYSVYTPYMKKWMTNFNESQLKPYESKHHLNKISTKKLESIEYISEIGLQKQLINSFLQTFRKLS